MDAEKRCSRNTISYGVHFYISTDKRAQVNVITFDLFLFKRCGVLLNFTCDSFGVGIKGRKEQRIS